MGMAPYNRSYQRARGAPAAGCVLNRACDLTDQGGNPDPADLAWCIRRRWRVIYYSARRAAGQSLWEGVDDFEVLMTDVLWRLSSGFEPIAPIRPPEAVKPEDRPADLREDRVYQLSCRVFRTPVFRRRQRAD